MCLNNALNQGDARTRRSVYQQGMLWVVGVQSNYISKGDHLLIRQIPVVRKLEMIQDPFISYIIIINIIICDCSGAPLPVTYEYLLLIKPQVAFDAFYAKSTAQQSNY